MVAAREAERLGRELNLGSAIQLETMAVEHLAVALPLTVSGGWMGDHWLHTFALLAFQASTHDVQLQASRREQPKISRL